MDSARLGTSNSDTCTYSVHFSRSASVPDSRLASLCAHVSAYASNLARGYLWHKQPFHLALSPLSFSAPATVDQHRYLEGKQDVTDAIDDEWFVVWLLQQISLEFTDAVISVEDDDGEFLLIEAADVLPNWVTPQNAANRLWIHAGHLHLVPLVHKSSLPFEQGETDDKLNPSFDPDEDGFIDRQTAIELVRDPQVDTRAPGEVEEMVWARINGYPDQIREHHHQTLAYLPTEIARALEESPELVSEAVGAFYERDPAMLKACNTMSRFPPSAPLASTPSVPASSSDMTDSPSTAPSLPPTVLVPTRLTRPLYSQLVLQRFYAPKPFEKVGWTEGKLGKDDERRRSVGMKIACGFEMLYKQTAPLPRTNASIDASTAFDPSKDHSYQVFLRDLTEKGFFRDQVEGSQEWQALEAGARKSWLEVKSQSPERSFAQRVDEAIERARARSCTAPVLSNRIENPATFPESKARQLEDSEDWLTIDQEGLEDMLRERGGEGRTGLDEEGFSDEESEDGEGGEDEMKAVGGENKPKTKEEKEEERRTRNAAKRLEAMAGKVEDFVQGRGAVQGALFDDERSDDGASEDEEEDEDEEMPTMTAEERASRLETLVAPLPISEWGQQTSTAPEALSEVAPPPLASTTSSTLPDRPSRPAKFEAEKYDGASSDSDTDDEPMEGQEGLDQDGAKDEDDEAEEAPAVIDDDEMLDMGEEMDEFLKFATETLGLSEEQYQGILGERRQRGAFVPGPSKDKKVNVIPSASTPSSTKPAAAKQEKATAAAVRAEATPRQPTRNPNLADFDSLMEQMEVELSNARKQKGAAAPPPAWKPSTANDMPTKSKPNAASASNPAASAKSNRVVIEDLSDSDDDDDEDVERMDAELSELLKGLSGHDEGGTMDYNLVKNFLDSFQSQGGFAGPAGNLAGRMGFNLPKDTQQ